MLINVLTFVYSLFTIAWMPNNAPLYSSLTLFAEIVISAIIYYTIYQGYKNNKFLTKLATFALSYEIIFNISYMVYRTFTHKETVPHPPAVIALAAIHGSLSLLMFLSLIVFFVLAWKNYKKGLNFFKDHRNLTLVFLIFWTFSVVSGIIFYFVEYLL